MFEIIFRSSFSLFFLDAPSLSAPTSSIVALKP
jgi:hypothetical protein